MNFHQVRASIEAHPSAILRYEPEYSRQATGGRVGILERLAARATAPVMGSQRIFPRRFDRAFGMLLKDPTAIDVAPEHAAWYYGAELHMDVDPLSLRHRISDWVRDQRGVRWMGTSFLDAADWSAALTPLAKSPIHREMLEIVAAEGDVRDTRAYRNLMLAIQLGRPSRRNNLTLTTVEAVEAYIRYCRDLIKSMRRRGAMRHSESGSVHRMRIKHWNARSPVHDSTERDIGVAIAENGEMIRHLGGKHRTAIAQALKLPTLPIEVRMVQTGWLAKQVERSGLPPHLALVEGVRLLAASCRGNVQSETAAR